VEELLAFAREAEPGALPDLLSALGRFRCPGLAQEIAGLADHPQAEVRLVVAQALNQQSDASSPAVAALVRLSADTVEEVRSWATFALAGDHFHDVPGVDEALRARLTDLSPDVRVEAIRGLGRNGDAAVVEAALDLAPGRADDPVYLDAVSQLTVRFSPMLLVCPF
jgi:HEAT repeat protein